MNFRFYLHNDSRGFFGSQIMAPGILFRRSIRSSGFLNFPSGSGTAAPSGTDMNALQEAIVTMFGMPAVIEQGFVADFASNAYTASRYATVYTRAHQYDSYLQDEWHLKKNLTLNAGVRWEYNPPPFDAQNTLGTARLLARLSLEGRASDVGNLIALLRKDLDFRISEYPTIWFGRRSRRRQSQSERLVF